MKIPPYREISKFQPAFKSSGYEEKWFDRYLAKLLVWHKGKEYLGPREERVKEFARRVAYYTWLGFGPYKARWAAFFPPME